MSSHLNTYFLGLELATDQLKAAVIDANLTVLGYETVDFDTELQYGTRGGLFSTPGDAYTTPVDMWVKAMDVLFQKLGERFDLGKPATVWLTPESAKTLASLSPKDPLSTQISPSFFSLLHTPVTQDTSTIQQTVLLQEALGGPDAMVARVGVTAQPSLIAVQCMKIREGNPDAWKKTGRVMMASTFLSSLLAGRWMSMSQPEVTGTGMWNIHSGGWDPAVLSIIAGNQELGRRFAEVLGTVESFGGKAVGTVSRYFIERYGFDKDTFLVPFTSDRLASYLGVSPSQDETILSFGAQDTLMVPATHYVPNKLYTLYPHPAQDPSEPRRYIAMITNRNADAARAMVRDMYTKSWSAFDRLISVIPPGGSIGLDDKLFSFWILHNEAPSTYAMRKGVYRIEVGHRVNEFRDLRANPRCLLESQVLSFRVQFARLMSTPLFATKNPRSSKKKLISMSLLAYRMGAAFDPYDKDLCPSKIIAIGSAANFPSVVAMIGDIFNSPVYVPTGTPLLSPNSPSPKKLEHSPGGVNSSTSPVPAGPNTPAPARLNAALGSAFTARWAWRRATKPDERFASFEDEVKALLRKKWLQTTVAGLHGAQISPSTSIGYPQPKRSGLSAAVFTPEDDESATPTHLSLTPPHPATLTPPGLIGLGLGVNGSLSADGTLTPVGGTSTITRTRTPTTSSQTTNSTVLSQLSITTLSSMTSGTTAHTSPGATSPHSVSTPINICVSALPSTTEEDLQAGLCKVAEADWDSFMTYASIVPEFCRVEGMLVKGY
ncbi:hypothetical protein FRB99_000873 [Tulasnella sp. 403]|nr:hypothetical protein FRB99_000873 [Tulasnella sp. 403]